MSETLLVEAKEEDMKKDDIIIAFMGPTGAGKTNFIDNLEGSGSHRAGHNLKSPTEVVTPWRLTGHAEFQDRIVLIDTPSFNNGVQTDMEVLQEIATWLQQTYEREIYLSGVVYLQQITDVRMAERNFWMFTSMCGEKVASRVRLITTMWDGRCEDLNGIGSGKTGMDVYERREKALTSKIWKGMLDNQATAGRYFNNSATAWSAIAPLLSVGIHGERLRLSIQRELVDHHLQLSETTAGKLAYDHNGACRFFDIIKLREEDRLDAQRQSEALEREYHIEMKKAKQAGFKVGLKDITHEDTIILILGQTGSGRSTFVKAVSGYDTGIDDYSLSSCTNDIFMVKCAVPTEDGQESHVVLVDTPGFDHSLRSNSSVVAQLAQWMMALYKLDRFISGIVHLHPIANQISQTVLSILHMVQEFWGDAEPSRLIISTSFWPRVIKNSHTEHEALLAKYCPTPPLRFNLNVQGSALSIVTELLRHCDDKVHPVPKLQHELVDKKLPLHRTALAMRFPEDA